MKVATVIACHERAFAAFGGVPRKVLYDNMRKLVMSAMERRWPAPLPRRLLGLSPALLLRHQAVPAIRAKSKRKVDRFDGYQRRSFYVPLASRRAQSGLQLDAVTANAEMAR
jgi:transposase